MKQRMRSSVDSVAIELMTLYMLTIKISTLYTLEVNLRLT